MRGEGFVAAGFVLLRVGPVVAGLHNGVEVDAGGCVAETGRLLGRCESGEVGGGAGSTECRLGRVIAGCVGGSGGGTVCA